jgi:hypothetical protein
MNDLKEPRIGYQDYSSERLLGLLVGRRRQGRWMSSRSLADNAC